MFISFANQNLAVFCVKRPWNGFRFSWNFAEYFMFVQDIPSIFFKFLDLNFIFEFSFEGIQIIWKMFLSV